MNRKIFLAALLALTLLFISAGAEASGEKPALSGGSYIIKTPQHLSWFRSQVNGGKSKLKARLAGNINLEGVKWIPIGKSESSPFNGAFDGRGFLILNMKSEGDEHPAGLFGFVDYGANISDINILDASVVVKGKMTSGAGILASVNRGLIRRCRIEGSSISAESLRTGADGIAVGGMVGVNDGGLIMEAIAARNKINVSADNKNASVGGVVGKNYGGSSGDGVLQGIISAHNRIYAEALSNETDLYASGIAGLMLGGTIKQSRLNAGVLVAKKPGGNSASLGGIAGGAMQGSKIEESLVTVGAAITAEGGENASSVGGIVGEMAAGEITGSFVKEAILTADGELSHNVGGIAGTLAGARVYSCGVAKVKIKGKQIALSNVGAVAGVSIKADFVKGAPSTLIEDTFYLKTVAGGRAVGIDDSPDKTDAIAADLEEIKIPAD